MLNLTNKYESMKDLPDELLKDHIPVFTYGSLMSGMFANRMFTDSGSHYGGAFVTKDPFVMYSLGGFPGIVSANHCPDKHATGLVIGELYWVPEYYIPMLDRYENVPDLYIRQEISVQPWRYLPKVSRFSWSASSKVQGYTLTDTELHGTEEIVAPSVLGQYSTTPFLSWRSYTGGPRVS